MKSRKKSLKNALKVFPVFSNKIKTRALITNLSNVFDIPKEFQYQGCGIKQQSLAEK